MPAPNGMTPRYYGSASNNPNSLRSETKMFTRNFVPARPVHGFRLLFNNTRFSLRNSNNGLLEQVPWPHVPTIEVAHQLEMPLQSVLKSKASIIYKF